MLPIKIFKTLLFAAAIGIAGCEKPDYEFGSIKTPTDLDITTEVAGADAANPDGNGTGNVVITTTANNAITYNIDFGDGTTRVVPSGKINYKYSRPGTYEYTITANAVGTGGAITTLSKKVKVFVSFVIPTDIITGLTGGSSKTWVSANETPGHFGVGPVDAYAPIWYAAAPNERSPCAYDDEVTFTKDANNNISMTIDNKGQSFAIGAAAAFYGFGGGDACFNIDATATRQLAFMDATSGSTPANSTRIQFTVPGNGIIVFGTGGTTYEILKLTDTEVHLRNIGIDGNSWYQVLKAK